MQRFKPGRGYNKLLRGGEAAARREEDHEEERSLYQLGCFRGREHHVVLGPGGGFFEEDLLLLRVPRRPHARGLHRLRCTAAAKAVQSCGDSCLLLLAAKMQNAAPLAPVVVLIASPVHSQAKLQQSTSFFARLENFGA